MCNFVPGEVLVFGPMGDLLELGGDLPGSMVVQPLVTEVGDLAADSPFVGFGSGILRTDPGLELWGLSQLSARLAPLIRAEKAVVDLNHILPLGAAVTETEPIRLSPFAEKFATSLRALLRDAIHPGPVPPPIPIRVAVLDSGLSPQYNIHRSVSYYDYSKSGRLNPDAPMADPIGHGTRVVKILDEILPPHVEMVVGRLPSEPGQLTSLTIANALGDLVARTSPEILNLSVATRDDIFFCKKCNARVHVPAFMPTFLTLILRLAGKTGQNTVTVMAAGNTGQIANSRWLNPDLSSVLIAVAQNRRGERTKYSGAPEGPLADLYSAAAFGGDDPEEPNAMGAFTDGSHGTSFAAPFLSAAALLGKNTEKNPADKGALGPRVRTILHLAETGYMIR